MLLACRHLMDKSISQFAARRESAMAGINAEAEQREQLIAETEQRITGLHDHIYTSCIIDGNQFLVNGSNKIYCRYAL